MGKGRTATRARRKAKKKAPDTASQSRSLVAPEIDSLLQTPDPSAGTARKFPEGKVILQLGAAGGSGKEAAAPEGSAAAPEGSAGAPEGSPALDPLGHTMAWRSPCADLSTCPVAVRAAAPADGGAIAALWKEMSRLHSSLGEEWAVVEGAAERYARGVASAQKNPRLIYLVAEMETAGAWRIAGFLHAAVSLRNSVFQESVVGEIGALCVAPDACGRGVGSALVVAAMDWFRKRGIAHVEAAVPSANGSARAFFKAGGFRESACVLWAEVPPGVSSVESGSP